MENQVKANQAVGGVVIACGIAEFDPARDKGVTDVFERADSAMYENKKALKGLC